MRRKLREIMDKEEGFTLVELLAVIVILGIIVAIAVPSIGKVIENSRKSATDAETELVKDAARIYFAADEPNSAKKDVPVSTLIDEGYLELKKASKESYTGKSVFKNADGTYEIKATTGAAAAKP